MRCKVGDPISNALSASYKPDTGSDGGPWCYLCGRTIRNLADKHWVAVGPGERREIFIKAVGETDGVVVGASCLKRVPLESIIPPMRKS